MPERKTIEVIIGQKAPTGSVANVKGERAPRQAEVSGRWHVERVICPYCEALNFIRAPDPGDPGGYTRFYCWNCGFYVQF